MWQSWHSVIEALCHIFSPRVCQICGTTLTEGEDLMCTGCLLNMPRTHFHMSQFNELHKRLGPAVTLDRAAAWYYYAKHSAYARLIVDTKYNARPRQGQTLGRLYARELQQSGFFSGIDALVPVPMHWTKRLMRGYNQTEEICKGIAEVTNIPITEILKAPVSHGVQSRHSMAQRATALKDTFAATSGAKANDGKHLLVVDDIITTGATIKEATAQLHAACPASPISVLALAATL